MGVSKIQKLWKYHPSATKLWETFLKFIESSFNMKKLNYGVTKVNIADYSSAIVCRWTILLALIGQKIMWRQPISVCVYCYFRIYSTDSSQIDGSFEKQWGVFWHVLRILPILTFFECKISRNFPHFRGMGGLGGVEKIHTFYYLFFFEGFPKPIFTYFSVAIAT